MKNYKEIWDNLSTTLGHATHFVCCVEDEDEIRSNGALTAQFLRDVLQIGPEDRVLEIGCGIARIGKELAPYCNEWHGADISRRMVAYAAERTAGMQNVFLHELPESDLSIFNDDYFDVVYSSIVFMHLDKPDMYSYISDSYRVLRPGGRAYFDTYSILGPEGWQDFLALRKIFVQGRRPGHLSQFSTPQEMQKFMDEAGFVDVHVDGSNPKLVVAVGRKEAVHEAPPRPSTALRPGGTTSKHSSEDDMADQALSLHALESVISAMRLDISRLIKRVAEQDDFIAEQSRYLQELEQAIETKDRHIARLERLTRTQERRLAASAVRAALGLNRLLGRKGKNR